MSIREELENVVPAKLAVERVSKRFFTGRSGEVHALDEVSLQVNVGGFLCLVGPSGCGKSTLLNIIAGLEKPDSGQVLADGKPITEPGRDRMVMFQEPALFPWLDVMGNVLFGLKLKPGLNDKERREVAEFYLKLVGLERFMHANIHQLSGGMKQRVALRASNCTGTFRKSGQRAKRRSCSLRTMFVRRRVSAIASFCFRRIRGGYAKSSRSISKGRATSTVFTLRATRRRSCAP